MPRVEFIPSGIGIDVDEGTKVLVAARRAKIDIRFGCGACRCGTCAVKISGVENLSEMGEDEKTLLTRIGLPTDGTVRFTCRAKVMTGTVTADLDFQNTYTPMEALDEED